MDQGLIRHPVSTITALDTPPEMIEIARSKVGSDPRVHFIAADVFSWSPPKRFDVVVFGNFLSHVPQGHFEVSGTWLIARSPPRDVCSSLMNGPMCGADSAGRPQTSPLKTGTIRRSGIPSGEGLLGTA